MYATNAQPIPYFNLSNFWKPKQFDDISQIIIGKRNDNLPLGFRVEDKDQVIRRLSVKSCVSWLPETIELQLAPEQVFVNTHENCTPSHRRGSEGYKILQGLDEILFASSAFALSQSFIDQALRNQEDMIDSYISSDLIDTIELIPFWGTIARTGNHTRHVRCLFRKRNSWSSKWVQLLDVFGPNCPYFAYKPNTTIDIYS